MEGTFNPVPLQNTATNRVVKLEDESDVLAAETRQLTVGRAGQHVIAEDDVA